MNPPTLATPKFVFKSLALLLLLALHLVAVRADSTDGSTPLALKPGAPAGSYALSDLDNINPYNGSLNFRLPLMSIGGRGGAAYTMTLPIEQKWLISDTPIYLLVLTMVATGLYPNRRLPIITFRQPIGGPALSLAMVQVCCRGV